MKCPKYPSFLADIAGHNARILIEKGIGEEKAIEVGCEVAEFFRAQWGGLSIYVPKGQKFEQSKRDVKIYEEFDGSNMVELCRKYELSDRKFRTIITGVRLAYRKKVTGGNAQDFRQKN